MTDDQIARLRWAETELRLIDGNQSGSIRDCADICCDAADALTRLQQERDDYAELAGKKEPVYENVTDHFREMAARFAEDRDKLKHKGRELQATVDRLTAALRGLKGNCFCQHGIGNPMYPYHSDACLAAQAALTPADPEET